jgi:DNA polymerase I-like protein with 3'-5' exonuclease and polymerase domains
MFAIDVETDGLHTKTNSVLWIGLASSGTVSIIPMGHPNGDTNVPEHQIDVPIEGTSRPYKKNPEKFTKPKTKKVMVPATFHPPPTQLRPDIVFDELAPLLLPDRYHPKTAIGHNLKFDIMSIAKYYGDSYLSDTRLKYADTLVLSHLLDERRREYGLKPLVGKWIIGYHGWADKKKRMAFYPDLGSRIQQSSFPDVARYLARDVYYTWLLWWKNWRMLPESLLGAFEAEMDTYRVIMAMQDRGVMMDEALLQEIQTEVQHELDDIEVDAWKISGRQFSLTNNNIKRQLLFDSKAQGGQGLAPLGYSRTGLPQVDRTTTAHYRTSNKLASCFYDHSVAQAKAKFIQQMLDNILNGRIHCQFNQHKAETGRLSSSEPNLQNVPKEGRMRDAFVAASGHKLIVADYDQIELRCIACLSEDPEMIALFQEGRDIHREAAATMLGIKVGQVDEIQRDMGKTVNFSVGYGATAHRVARIVGCTVQEAQEFIDRYYLRFARLQPWKLEVLRVAVDRGDKSDITRKPPYVVIPPFNRRRRVEELYDPLPKIRAAGQRQAVNAVVQGFASYIMKLAMVGLHDGLTHGHLELQVHDEAIIEVEQEYAVPTLDEVVEIMQSVQWNGAPILGDVPLIASAHIGSTWKQGKGK